MFPDGAVITSNGLASQLEWHYLCPVWQPLHESHKGIVTHEAAICVMAIRDFPILDSLVGHFRLVDIHGIVHLLSIETSYDPSRASLNESNGASVEDVGGHFSATKRSSIGYTSFPSRYRM
jgi:hypothetical protein